SSQAEQLAQTISFFKVEGAAPRIGAALEAGLRRPQGDEARRASSRSTERSPASIGKTSAKPVKALPAAGSGLSPKPAAAPRETGRGPSHGNEARGASSSSPGRSDATGITVKDDPDATSLGDDDFEEF
ncbi:MAG TPA: hypothetical protein P5117_03685, partial [Spirochaetia bacterium]|nr:hypothetical protein [Spirochaetia bacterium]